MKQLTQRNKFKVIPGWNRNVKHLYSNYREKYLNWIANGKMRDGPRFEVMGEARKLFKSALNDCKLNENRESSLSIQEKYENKNMKSFWFNVQQKNNRTKYSEIIDGKNISDEIIQIFNDKFFDSDNEKQNVDERDLVNELKYVWQHNVKFHPRVSVERLRELIKRLNVGEGHDYIHTLFLRKMSNNLLQLISSFMNACFSHCFVPESVLNGDINPTIKDAKENSTESSNYRQVMQSSNLLKLFEIHILDIISEKISFNNNHFGYRKYTSTTDACLILKETINKYITYPNEKVFCLYVDLSKAFDKLDHILLGHILIKRKLPPDLVLFLMHYLMNQRARILWNGSKGDYYNVRRGVRQGGILSPFLFKLYIDDILDDLCNSNVGCKIGITRVNVLAYADDIVLIVNTQEHLEILYRILSIGMSDRKLCINKSKTKCMIFQRNRNRQNNDNNIRLLEDNFDIVSQYKYLGHVMQENLSDINDVNIRLNSFYGKFNWVLRNFRNVTVEVLYFLFGSFCLPDYGLPLWNLGELNNKLAFKTFTVAFSNALKKILGVPFSTSSRGVAEVFNQLLFYPYVTFVQIRYFKRIFNSPNPFIKKLKFHIKNAYLYRAVSENVKENYNCDILCNDLDVLQPRLFFVQNHEPRTGRPVTNCT